MSLQSELNRAEVGRLADYFRTVAIGDVLSRLAGDAAVEEVVTVSSNVGVLSARAISILAITATAGTVTGAITPYSASVTPITKTCQIGTDRKTLTFFATDAVTTAKVTYLKAPTRAADGSTLESLLAGTFEGL
jgi:hypothetical protein